MNRTIAKLVIAAALIGGSAATLKALPGRTAPKRVDVVIDAHMGHFTPRIINAQKGDTVHVTLRAMDTAHGFKVQGHENIDITAMPGMPAEVSFVVDWDGGVEWYCTFNCGPQHGSMSGMIVAAKSDAE
jgi:heme/copper-type cytochrome/quinol oxidase subunit 2